MEKEKMLRVGVFSSTHGIRGEIRVYPTTEDPRRFEDLPYVFLDTREGLVKREIARVRYQKNMVLLSFKEVEDINQIEAFKGCDLLIPRELALPLAENEVFIGDILGAAVQTEEGTVLGTLKEILTTHANDVYVVERKGEKDLLIPSIPACIRSVDPEKKEVTVRLLPGLEEL